MKFRICLFTLFMSMSTVMALALTHEAKDSDADDWLWLRLLIWFGLMAGLNYYMKKSEAKERARRAADKALTPGSRSPCRVHQTPPRRQTQRSSRIHHERCLTQYRIDKKMLRTN